MRFMNCDRLRAERVEERLRDRGRSERASLSSDCERFPDRPSRACRDELQASGGSAIGSRSAALVEEQRRRRRRSYRREELS
jgi:hypothetical protein